MGAQQGIRDQREAGGIEALVDPAIEVGAARMAGTRE